MHKAGVATKLKPFLLLCDRGDPQNFTPRFDIIISVQKVTGL